MNALRDLDLLEKPPHKNGYRFTVGLVRRWVVENYSVWDLLEEYRNQVTSALCSPSRRETARIIDVLFAVALIWLVAAGVGESKGIIMSVLVCMAFLGLFGTLFRGTPGSKLLHLRFVNEIGASQSRLRVFLYGLYSAVPISLLVVGGWMVIKADSSEPQLIGAAVVGGAGFVVIVLNTIMIHFGKRRQTLWDKFTHNLVVHSSKGLRAK
jgi:hypothetical protein